MLQLPTMEAMLSLGNSHMFRVSGGLTTAPATSTSENLWPSNWSSRVHHSALDPPMPNYQPSFFNSSFIEFMTNMTQNSATVAPKNTAIPKWISHVSDTHTQTHTHINMV